MINFGDEEQPLFRHRAQCKAKDGEVLVTSVRFVFVANDGGNCKEFSWAAIQGVKYSPPNDPKGRAMILLKTSVKGDEDIIITLLGSSKEKNFGELENLKGIVSKLRKGKGSSGSSTNNLTSANEVGNKRPVDSAVIGVDAKRRRQLLEHDRHLAKQYRDLVVVSKILTDDDFWASHANHIQQFGEFRSAEFRKGKENALLLANAVKGGREIDLTLELRQTIFAMYPEVWRAFQAEVPLKRNESEFWQIYFRSEYYNGSSSNGGSDLGRGSSREEPVRDELFERYADQQAASSSSSSFSASASAKRKIDAQLQHADVDLTASFGDYRPAESLDASSDRDLQLAAGSGKSALGTKYNRNSALVLGEGGAAQKKVGGGSGGGGTAPVMGGNRAATQLTELLIAPEPSYIDVRVVPEVSNRGGDTKSSTGGASAGAPATGVDCEAIAAQIRAASEAPYRLPVSSIPLPERANKLFVAETTRLRKQGALGGGQGGAGVNGHGGHAVPAASALSQDGSTIMGLLGVEVGAPVVGVDTSKADDLGGDGLLLDDSFKQEMLEAFTDTTELLRHFYTVLSRAGATTSSTSTSSSTAASRAEAILQRLQEVNAKSLEARKRQIAETQRASADKREAALAVVNNILLLVQRASVTWGIFNSNST